MGDNKTNMKGTTIKHLAVALLVVISSLPIIMGFSAQDEHPFYVSVTEVEHNQKTNRLEFSVATFSDDVERMLLDEYGLQGDIQECFVSPTQDSLLQAYVLGQFEVYQSGRMIDLNWVGCEFADGDAMYFYIESSPILKDDFTIRNEFLVDQLNDQINIMHFSGFGSDRSAHLTRREPVFELSF